MEYFNKVKHSSKYSRHIQSNIQFARRQLCLCDQIMYVRNQTEETCCNILIRNPHDIKYVRRQTYKMCLIAVKKDGFLIKYVKFQTNKLCRIAIDKNPESYLEIKNPSPELTRIAISRDSMLMEYLDYQPDDLCIAVIIDHWPNIVLINNIQYHHIEIAINEWAKDKYRIDLLSPLFMLQEDIPMELMIKIINIYPGAINDLDDQPEELCLIAVQLDGSVLKYIKNPTLKIREAAKKMIIGYDKF